MAMRSTHRHAPAGNPDSGVYQKFTNSGVAVGIWFYFVKPVPYSEHTTYPDPRSVTFWRVNLKTIGLTTPQGAAIPPQYEQLPNHPEYHQYMFGEVPPYPDISTNFSNPSFYQSAAYLYWRSRGPLFVYDEDSHSILSIGAKVWVFDLDTKTWMNASPAQYKRGLGIVGALKRSNSDPTVREVIYKASAWYDYNSGTTVTNAVGETGSRGLNFHRLVLTGQKPRARFVPRVIRNNFGPGGPSGEQNPWRGKHLRLIYSRRWNNINPSNPATGAPVAGSGGYVWQFGGDFVGAPHVASANVAGYPPVTGGTWNNDSSRQDCWRAKVEEVGGAVEMDMSSNFCAFYPFQGGGPDPASVSLGPPAPDGVCAVVDKRGDFWVGPGYARFDSLITNPPVAAKRSGPCMPMFRFRMPGEHSNGVRMGNGWHEPAQNYLLPTGTTPVHDDDIFVGSNGTMSFTGVSNNWGGYDEKEDAVVIMARNTFSNAHFYKFPCLPTGGRHVWERTVVPRNKAPWYAFLNTLIRPGATPFAVNSNEPAEQWHGAHVVARDHLYVISQARGSGVASRVAYITKWNLRNLAEEPEYIPIPVQWCRGWDAPDENGSQTWNGSVPEFRDIQLLGHLIVLSPAYIGVEDTRLHQFVSDPWLCWYNLNTKKWTKGQSYAEMKTREPSLPDFGLSVFKFPKGGFCTVEETGEAWVNLAGTSVYNGIIKYRIF
ncbi:MAG: hypothetical protein KIS91_02050 [Anaerolineae bacterium]|nr:hypothetical protein [Anaerolineae bacterium]